MNIKHQNNRQNISKKKFSKKLSSKIMGWFTTVFFVLILHDSQLILSKTFLWMIQTKMKLFFLKTSPDRLNLEMVFDVIDQPTSQSVVCSVFCHYPWKFCNKNTRCERVVLVDAPDYTVESLFWFQLGAIFVLRKGVLRLFWTTHPLTEGFCLKRLLGLGKSRISQKWH